MNVYDPPVRAAMLLHMSDSPVHDWLRPRLRELVEAGEAAGFDRQIIVAVVTDLITGPDYNSPNATAPDPGE